MKRAREFSFFWTALFAATISFFVAPEIARAHGELLIRIADITKELQTATTNKAELFLQRGELHREDKDWNAAESDYARAEQFDSKLEVDFFRAKMLFDSGQFAAARVMFDKAIVRNPANGEAFVGRARVFVKLGERKLAVADFQRDIGLISKPSPEIFLELARTFAAAEKVEEALRTLDAGIKTLGVDVSLQSCALELEIGRKNYEAALTRLDTILQHAPRKESWFTQRGEILLALGRQKEAMQEFGNAEAAIRKLPKVLQQAPPMQKLQAQINDSLARTAENSSAH